MRNQCLATWMLIAASAGCAMPNFPGMSPRMAQQAPPQQQLAARPAPQGPSFTQKITGMIPGMPSPGAKPSYDEKVNSKTDPIALGYPQSPPTAELYLSMAELSDQRGNTDHARTMYQRALSMQPNNLDALLGLARMEDRDDRFEVAVNVYQQAMRMHPQNAKVLNDLALCHARKGQMEPAFQLLDRATRLEPGKARYRNNIAKVLIEMNRVDEAVSHLAAAHPPAIAQYNMGVLLAERGRKDEAIGFLTAATHIDSQLQPASAMLAQLQGSATQVAKDDGILPTPMAAPVAAMGGGGYPSTGMTSQRPLPMSFPAETAQVPVGNSPLTLPPVR